MKNHRYSGGASVLTGIASPLVGGSLSELYQYSLSRPLEIRFSRSEFSELSSGTPSEVEQAQRAKLTAFITGAKYEDSSPRKTQTPEFCNLIILDYDDSSVAVNLLKGDRWETFPYDYVAYHTLRSLPEAPRVRVIVAADSIPIGEYARAVKFIEDLLECRSAPESKSPYQAMFLPSCFKGEASRDGVIISRRFSGSEINIGDCPPDDAPKRVDKLADIEKYEVELSGITIALAHEMLQSIDPGIVYGDWIKIACGLRHQFGWDASLVGEAEELWVAWSAGSFEKYEGEEKCRKKWDTFFAVPRGKSPITFRTLVKMAREAGWDSSGMKSASRHSICAAIARATTWGELEGRILHAIRGCAVLEKIDCESLLSMVRAKGKSLLPPETMEVSMKVLRDHFEQGKSKKEAPKTPPTWTDGLVYSAPHGLFFRTNMSAPPLKAAALDLRFAAMDIADASSPSLYLLKDVKIPAVDAVEYNPTTTELIYHKGSALIMNTYRKTYVEPDPSLAPEAGELWENHLKLLISNDDERAVLGSFFAYLVQNPGENIRWAPVIQGAHGCGKSSLVVFMEMALGSTNVLEVTNDLFSSQWTGYVKRQLLVYEELRVPANDRGKGMMERLKTLITGDKITTNERWVGEDRVDNHSNCIFLVNRADAFPVEEGERRYFCVACKQQTKGDVEAIGEAYFEKLFELQGRLAGGLRHYLQTVPLSPLFKPRGQAMNTDARSRVIQLSQDPDEAAVWSVIDLSENPLVRSDIISSTALASMMPKPAPAINKIHRVLSGLGFTRMDGRIRLCNGKHHVWVHRSCPMNPDQVKETIQQRETEI